MAREYISHAKYQVTNREGPMNGTYAPSRRSGYLDENAMAIALPPVFHTVRVWLE